MILVGTRVAAAVGAVLGWLAGSGPAVAQDLLFGAAFVPAGAGQGAGGPSTLYSIDPATGLSTAVGSGIGFDKVGAIDFDPISGQLFGIGDLSGMPRTPQLITIDPTTGAGTAVGALTGTTTVRNAYTDLSFDSGGTLYLLQDIDEQLFTVNTSTGAASALPNAPGLGGVGNAIAFDLVDTLFWAAFDSATLDPTTGLGTAGMSFTFPGSCGSPRLAAADFASSGEAFAALKCAVEGQDDQLAQVDFVSGAVTDVGPFIDATTMEPIIGMDALAFQQLLVSPD